MKRVLISGGTGMVGQRLSELLEQNNYEVCILSRTPDSKSKYKEYKWDINEDYVDPEAILNTDYIIHLAGAGITDKRWTESRKKAIVNSRVNGADLLYRNVAKYNPKIKAFISSSGVGYYGAVTNDKIYIEPDNSGVDFAAQVCVKWELAAQKFESLGIRVVALRTAVVLSNEGGVLDRLKPIFKWGIGSPLGSGKQYFPWIHVDDLCSIYIHAIENNKLTGVFNAVITDNTTNNIFSKAFAKTLNKPFWAPKVPAFVLKIVLGEMSEILLNGSRVSNAKIIQSGFKFQYDKLEDTLDDLIH